ncbi:MAG: AAA family ATPase [Granulosicoccaceae bacterium]
MSQLPAFQSLRTQLQQRVVGQSSLLDSLLIALLCRGHLLVEGAPGLAKTRAVKALSDLLDGDFQRLQFTPDLLPADLTGTEVYRPEDGSFVFQHGPLFHNLVLADEINRAPAKVQSALLEAMSEGQISVGDQTHDLPQPFFVMATQNSIEQEGTYPLPEAQLDRFLMHVLVDYPNREEEREILRLVRGEARGEHVGIGQSVSSAERLTLAALEQARQEVLALHMSEEIEDYVIRLVVATREPADWAGSREGWLSCGASPRATLSLDRCARAHAWLAGRDYVSPADVQAVLHAVLRHRLILSFEAESAGVTAHTVIEALLDYVAAP